MGSFTKLKRSISLNFHCNHHVSFIDAFDHFEDFIVHFFLFLVVASDAKKKKISNELGTG